MIKNNIVENICFIKNEEEYYAYRNQKPINKYKYKKVKFICTKCKNITIKNYASLKIPFLCTSCTCKNAQNNVLTKAKRNATLIHEYGINNISQLDKVKKKKEETCLEHFGVKYPAQAQDIAKKQKQTYIERYGVDNPMKNNEILEKQKQTCLNLYGVENISQLESIKQQKEITCLEHYGTKYPAQAAIIKEKMKTTCIEKYGIENPFQLPSVKDKVERTCLEHFGVKHATQSNIVKEKMKSTFLEKYGIEHALQLTEFKNKAKTTCIEKYGKEFYVQTEEHKQNIRIKTIKTIINKIKDFNLHLVEYSENKIKLKCNNCTNIFSYSKSHFNFLVQTSTICFCPACSRITYNGKSYKEKLLVDFIKNSFNGIIIENDRTVLDGKEIDIYLPELNLGIEFDGTYWHADPRFYNSDYIFKNNITAKDLWKKDKHKDEIAKIKNIKLIRIKEYDWDTDTENTKLLILNELKLIQT